jgi:predicted RNA-binding Zn-ribbon protein involved in translation (DUF1610 family)
MKIEDFDSKLPGIRVKIGQIEVDPTHIVEHACFEDRSDRRKDYRDLSIDYFLKHKVDFHSTCNSIYNVAKRFIKIKCPKCGKNMELNGGGGNSSLHNLNYTCTCGTKANLNMPNEGFSVQFEDGAK